MKIIRTHEMNPESLSEAKTTWLKAYELTDGKTEWHEERVEKFSYESTVDGLNIYSFQTMNVEG